MKPFLSGLLYGSVIGVILSWSQYFFGNKPANYLILLAIFLAAHILFYFFKLKPNKFHPHIALIFLAVCPLLIYYSELLVVRKDTAIFIIVLVASFILNQIRPQRLSIFFLPGIVLGSCSMFLPLIFPQLILAISFLLLVWKEHKLYLFTRVIYILVMIGSVVLVYELPLYPIQKNVSEKIIDARHEQNDQLVITRQKGTNNFYLNKTRILSSAEYNKYSESFVVPYLNGHEDNSLHVLIIGGEDGIVISALRHLLPNARIECFAFRPQIQKHILTRLNNNPDSLRDGNLTIRKFDNTEAVLLYKWTQPYDLIFVDPLQNSHFDYSAMYNLEFLKKLFSLLPKHGQLIVSGFNEDVYHLSNQLVFNTLHDINNGVHTFQLPLNTSGLISWYVISKSNVTKPQNTSDLPPLQWYTQVAYDWISKSGKQKYPTHNLIQTQENQYLHQLKKKDSLNAILNF